MKLMFNPVKKLAIGALLLILAQVMTFQTSYAASRTVATVGSEKITEYDVKIRSNFLLIIRNIPSSSKARARVRKTVIKQLIDEELQLLAGKKQGMVAPAATLNKRISSIARGARMSTSQLAKFLKAKGSNISTMKQQHSAAIVWGGLIRAKFGASANVSEKQIEQQAKKLGSKFSKQTVYDLRHILLQMPSNANRAKRSSRLKDAAAIRAKFTKCSRIRSITASVNRVKITNRSNTSLGSLNSGQRNLVKAASIGSISKARTIKGGVEMFALCRKSVAHSAKTKAKIRSSLIQSKFKGFAADYLKTLHKEYKVTYR